VTAGGPGANVLEIDDLMVRFDSERGPVHALRGASLRVPEGQALAVVGESGAGKSVLAATVLGLTGPGAHVSGSVRVAGEEVIGASPDALRRLRGAGAGLVFQDPLAALHPQHRIGWELREAIAAHGGFTRAQSRARALELLELVGLPQARRRLRAYPHELSGGMRQRVMIAMALAGEPRLLIADEPTTALDVTVQAQILELLARLRRELGMAVLLITHDLAVAAQVADSVAVMYAGRVVEEAPAGELFAAPAHPYTWGLLRAVPRVDSGEPPVPIPGSAPSPLEPDAGCAFFARCAYARPEHARRLPGLAPAGPGHRAACLLDLELRRRTWKGAS
jgi:peptide/nickel transport system ATP-binding protein